MRILHALPLIPALLLASCSHSASTTQPTTAPALAPMEHVPLVLQLHVRPAELTANTPSDDPAQPKTLRLTLVVFNSTSRTFQGDSPDSAVARFALTTAEGEVIASAPQMVTQTVTPITLGPGQRTTYEALFSLPDIRVYKGQTLTAHASFSPTATKADATITIK